MARPGGRNDPAAFAQTDTNARRPMKSATRTQLLLATVAALIIVIVAWFAATRQTYFQASNLVEIAYTPPGGPAPYLRLTFSEPLDPSQVQGASAVLKAFSVAQDSPTPPGLAAPFLALLTQGPAAPGGGSQGPAPFVPEYSDRTPTFVTTNTLPQGITSFQQPLTVRGNGVVWFAAPRGK